MNTAVSDYMERTYISFNNIDVGAWVTVGTPGDLPLP